MRKMAFYGAAVALMVCMSTAAHAAEVFTLDPNHTNVVWSINHFGFSNPSGKIMLTGGTLTLDEDNPANSKVEATLSPDNIVTGIDKLDEHLKSHDFFDVAQYPTITFVSDHVEVVSRDAAKVSGALTLHGVTKTVVLDVKLNKIGNNMFGKKTAGFSASTVIKRSDFDMKTYLPGLGDNVAISIESEANLKQ